MLGRGFQLNGLDSIYFMSSFSFDQTVWNDQQQIREVSSDKSAILIVSTKKPHFLHTWFIFVLEQDSAEEWPDEFKKLQQVFRKHIKPKKKHEIIRMADVASMLASKANSKANSKAKANIEAELKDKEEESKNIIDIGGGLGHLSRLEGAIKDFWGFGATLLVYIKVN